MRPEGSKGLFSVHADFGHNKSWSHNMLRLAKFSQPCCKWLTSGDERCAFAPNPSPTRDFSASASTSVIEWYSFCVLTAMLAFVSPCATASSALSLLYETCRVQ